MRSWIIFDFDDTLGGVLINGQVSFTEIAARKPPPLGEGRKGGSRTCDIEGFIL